MTKRDDQPVCLLRVVPGGYVPIAELDQQLHGEFALGSVVHCTFHQPKSREQERLFWWVIGLIVPNLEQFPNARALVRTLLADRGYVDEMISLMGGGIQVVPRSLSTLDDAEFKAFMRSAFDRIYELFGIDCEEVIRLNRRKPAGDQT